MTRRWPGVIVMGWYLMGPPIQEGVVQPDARLKKWSHVENFDSARECEASQFMRDQRAAVILKNVQDDIRTGKAKLDDAYVAASAQWAFARRSQCINSNVPRLR